LEGGGVLSKKHFSCHPHGAYKLEVAPGVLENLYTLELRTVRITTASR